MPHPEQITSARNIVNAFCQDTHYALLVALCQAGKTGCFQEVARIMLETGQCERAYILCGSSEVLLREQAEADTKAANPGAPITVLFRTAFKEATMNLNKALIVVDESHLDQTQGQELDVFLGRHGLSMDGNPAALKANGAFLLSVDATPYAELAALTHRETPYPKHVEELKAGAGYYGLADYKFGGRLLPTFEITPYKFGRFANLVKRGGAKYSLVRLSKGKAAAKNLQTIRAAAAAVGAKVLLHTEKNEEISIAALKTAPAVPTIVVIYDRLRAGKVVPKQHINFVWEGARTSKTDSLVQGLPGRMCGYEFGDSKPLIFVPASALATREKKVVKASEIDRAIMGHPCALPTVGSNLAKGHIGNAASNGKVQLSPLRLDLAATDDDEWTPETAGEVDGGYFRALLLKSLPVIDSAPFSAAQKAEIKSFAATAFPHTRTLTKSTSAPFKHYFGSVIEAHRTATAVTEHVADCPEMTFFWAKDACVPGSDRRHVYVVFYTEAGGLGGGIMQAPLKSRIGKTNGRSAFSLHDNAFDQPIVAGGVAGFSEGSIATPEMLESSLRAYLAAAAEGKLVYARCIESAQGRFSLDKRVFHWLSAKENGVESVCAKLGAEFGVKMKVKYARGADGHFNVKTITW